MYLIEEPEQTEIPSQVWCYRHKGWQWSKQLGCYYYSEHPISAAPIAYCLGERYVHLDFGYDCKCCYRGSTPDNWHGWDFSFDLQDAILWVRNANNREWGVSYWGE